MYFRCDEKVFINTTCFPFSRKLTNIAFELSGRNTDWDRSLLRVMVGGEYVGSIIFMIFAIT